MRKSFSLKTTLFIPTFLAFALFVTAVVFTAYSLFSTNVTSSTNEQMLATSQQLLTNYETYFDSVLTTSNNVISKYSNETDNFSTISTNMGSYFDTVMSIKSEILDMSLYKLSDGNLIASNTSYVVKETDVISQPWFTKATNDDDSKLINFFSGVTTNPSGSGTTYSFILSKYIPFEKNASFNAVLKVDFDFSKIVQSISPSTLGEGGHFTIYDPDYNVIYSSTSQSTVEELTFLKTFVLGSKIKRFNNHSFYLYAATISNTSWRVAISINYDAVNGAIENFAIVIVAVGVAVMAVFALILIIISNSITRPIRKLQTEMADIESLNYAASLTAEIKGSKEVVELNHSFNQMMTRIKELTDKVVDEKEEQRKSELKALQNQINPHFLYNTLDSVLACIDNGESNKAEDMIVALSKFFRISISKGQNVIPLQNEIEHARNYLLIQKLRFGNAFSYDIKVEPGLEKYYVVKLILQPIVENSIGHGIKEDEEGHISIHAYADEEFLKFDISDNGYGMMASKVQELENSFKDNTVYQGVGLKNVYQRIRIYYGDKANILIHSEEDVGTTVTIVIPKEGALKHEE